MLKLPVTLKYQGTQQRPAATLLKTIVSGSYVISSVSPTNDHHHLNQSCKATKALPHLTANIAAEGHTTHFLFVLVAK